MGFSTCIAFCARPLTDDGQKYIPMPTSCCNPAPRGMSVFYVKNRNITKAQNQPKDDSLFYIKLVEKSRHISGQGIIKTAIPCIASRSFTFK